MITHKKYLTLIVLGCTICSSAMDNFLTNPVKSFTKEQRKIARSFILFVIRVSKINKQLENRVSVDEASNGHYRLKGYRGPFTVVQQAKL